MKIPVTVLISTARWRAGIGPNDRLDGSHGDNDTGQWLQFLFHDKWRVSGINYGIGSLDGRRRGRGYSKFT